MNQPVLQLVIASQGASAAASAASELDSASVHGRRVCACFRSCCITKSTLTVTSSGSKSLQLFPRQLKISPHRIDCSVLAWPVPFLANLGAGGMVQIHLINEHFLYWINNLSPKRSGKLAHCFLNDFIFEIN